MTGSQGQFVRRFADRTAAGRELARALRAYRAEHPVILALPRGGVPVAAEVARALDAPLDLVLVRKLGVPGQPEVAMGAVVDGDPPIVVRNGDMVRLMGVSPEAFEAARSMALLEIEDRRALYLGARVALAVADRVVIVVDDGIATGATTRAALRAVRRRGPRKLVLAVPVAPPEVVEALRQEVDDLICLQTPTPFRAVGEFYEDFAQVGDDAVVATLASLPAGPGAVQRS